MFPGREDRTKHRLKAIRPTFLLFVLACPKEGRDISAAYASNIDPKLRRVQPQIGSEDCLALQFHFGTKPECSFWFSLPAAGRSSERLRRRGSAEKEEEKHIPHPLARAR